MNTLTIVMISLQAAVAAIRMVEGFITDEKVKHILDEVAGAIEYALKRLLPHQSAAQKASACGKPVPATAPKPDAGEGEECEDEEDGDADKVDA